MSHELLYRFIESEHFDPLLAVVYLSRKNHVGVHHYLCTKLRQYSYEEIEFFLPQLCHICINIEQNESVALEEFILDFCEKKTHGALLTFWLLQTHLRELSANPHSPAFKTCARMFNKVQSIVFDNGERKKEPLQENVFPVTILASLILGSIAVPFLPAFAGPLAIAQARRPQVSDDAPTPAAVAPRISRSKTVTIDDRPRRRRERSFQDITDSRPGSSATSIKSPTTPKTPKTPRTPKTPKSTKAPKPPSTPTEDRSYSLSRRPSSAHLALEAPRQQLTSTSLPDLSGQHATPGANDQESLLQNKPSPPQTLSSLSDEQRIARLKSNYFRKETEFLYALEDISNRLVAVPKPARLSALRAELTLLERELPSEVDIPMICPANTAHHRIVRINPAEAVVLNSAERVPYLLMIEVLRNDFDFTPDSGPNEELLTNLLADPYHGKRRYFDLSESPRSFLKGKGSGVASDSVFEPSQGDIGASPLIAEFPEKNRFESGGGPSAAPLQPPSRATTASNSPASTPRNSDSVVPGRTNSPGGAKLNRNSRFLYGEQPDLSTLATHMRMAANMLTQLNASTAKRPKHEVEAIKEKIIKSMQLLEEESFLEDTTPIQTFDTIIANASAETATAETDERSPVNAQAGIARMENDRMTSGVQRKADRDDPSAATFGEEWTAKRERIRRSSPYGLYENWDLLSVIVKTGADLRQETFACQLIAICGKIWEKAGVKVWIRNMRILVTGESCGLIETITNGTSLHSLKRSLTLATASKKAPNAKTPIATLKDHFVKTFGKPETDTYIAAADAFMRSLAAYSLISYILQLKDRHNGNILLDNEGHIIHIDFGFMLSNSPGSIGFESAPFKLTQEYVDILGGFDSPKFQEFRTLCKQGFQALRKSGANLVDLVELMGRGSKMPCFSSGSEYATSQLRQRFRLDLSEAEAEVFVDEQLINKSYGSYFTRAYDQFQYLTQGIY